MTAPTTPPTERRTWQITDFANNRNAYWTIEVWGREPGMLVRVTHGRVGARPAKDAAAKLMSRGALQKLIQSKEAKGYVEVTLTPTGAISATQVAEGRALLDFARRAYDRGDWTGLVQTIERYCTTIPTRLPAQIDPQDVARMFAVNIAAQTTRLDQFAATAGLPTPSAPSITPSPRVQTDPQPGGERQARTVVGNSLDWTTLWLSSSDALRLEREGVQLPAVFGTADAPRDGRNDDVDFGGLGLETRERESRAV